MQNPQSTTGAQSAKPQPSPGSQSSMKDDLDALKGESSSARETLHGARESVQRKAGDYASEAKQAAYEQAEGAQRSMGESIAALGGAMRAAGDNLAQNQQNTMSNLMNEAANGIERFSESLKNRKFDEMLSDVRRMGRENSGALFAGSVLAGLAIGRFIKSSTPHSTTSGMSSPSSRQTGQDDMGFAASSEWGETGSADTSSAFGDNVEAGNRMGNTDPSWPPQEADSNVFGEGSGEKRP